MLRSLTRLFPLKPARASCFSSQVVQIGASSQPVSSGGIRYPYFIPRNSNGNLPVYSDIRNSGTRLQVLIRNVDGNANLLADELARTLFPRKTSEASRMKIEIVRSKNLVISGGRWKNQVVEWLKQKGF
ncbi:mitochondrial large subunit ribosomal protein-domain-containing protein [Cyathus striatus]|nr:mitochondrial large subunit ribosomal protein-domain-containing protein [Cyathus striatus]